MKKVLFICVHNSARSQMAEEFLRKLGGDQFEVESCGFEPSTINPYVVKAMAEEGIALSNKETKYIMDLFKAQKFYGYIITVCDRAREKDCPVFPGPGVQKKFHWDLEDPSSFTGTDEEIMEQVRASRDTIKALVEEFIAQEG